MQNRQILSFKAAGAISGAHIVKFDATDNEVVVAAAAADLSIGVAANENFDVAADETVDVVVGGVCRVKAGGTITRGQSVSADATGKAIVAAAASRVVGVALASAVSGDLVDILVQPGTVF